MTVTHRTPDGGLRTVTLRSPHDTTATNRNGSGGPNRIHVVGDTMVDRMILQMLLVNALQQGADHADQLSYEELLQRFGVGTEHRGASREQIDILPLQTLDPAAVAELKEQQTTCNICLEDFTVGQELRTLGCSHKFHRECIDHWLLQVASCPICKRDLEAAAAAGTTTTTATSATSASPSCEEQQCRHGDT